MKIFQEEFLNLINNDLDIPKALALIWKVVKNKDISKEEKYELLLNSDKVFGLRLDEIRGIKIPLKIKRLVEKREKYREEKDWERADEIRKKIEKLGYRIEDTKEGPKVKKIEN